MMDHVKTGENWGGGGGQPDSDMKVDFGEIGIGKIGKIGISDFFTPKFVFFAPHLSEYLFLS